MVQDGKYNSIYIFYIYLLISIIYDFETKILNQKNGNLIEMRTYYAYYNNTRTYILYRIQYYMKCIQSSCTHRYIVIYVYAI